MTEPLRNSHDRTAETVSPADAVDAHGGVYIGANVIKAQLEQIEQFKRTQAVAVQMEAQRQLAIHALQAEADAAQADFVAAMRSSDYQTAAKANRRMTRAETALVNLGAYHKDVA
jgi:uncharacterized protein YbjQ (UPF0145 family)